LRERVRLTGGLVRKEGADKVVGGGPQQADHVRVKRVLVLLAKASDGVGHLARVVSQQELRGGRQFAVINRNNRIYPITVAVAAHTVLLLANLRVPRRAWEGQHRGRRGAERGRSLGQPTGAVAELRQEVRVGAALQLALLVQQREEPAAALQRLQDWRVVLEVDRIPDNFLALVPVPCSSRQISGRPMQEASYAQPGSRTRPARAGRSSA
jgi:hypothetical protein